MQCHASTAATGGNGPRGCSAKLRHLPDATPTPSSSTTGGSDDSPVGGMKMQCHASTAATGGNGPRGCSAKLRHLPDATPTPSSSTTGGSDGEEPRHVTSNPAPACQYAGGCPGLRRRARGAQCTRRWVRRGRTDATTSRRGAPAGHVRRDNCPGDRAHASPMKTRTPKSSATTGKAAGRRRCAQGVCALGRCRWQ